MWKICQYICVQQPGFPLKENKLFVCQEEARRQLTLDNRAGAMVQNRLSQNESVNTSKKCVSHTHTCK